ncbi:MAG: competence/damage-inducible protein A [Actinomycetota bacterium]
MEIAVIVVGDEILSGHVQDANAHFITMRATERGHRVRKVTIVSDDPDAIAGELTRALDQSFPMVFVCGGLGPTHDDRTMEGVAAALGRSLEPSPVLRGWVDRIVGRIEGQGFTGDQWGFDALRKMELAPEGAEVVAVPGGYIPAVVATRGSTRIVVLPGPPRELQAIFTSIVEPRYLQPVSEPRHSEEIVHPFFESTVAKVLAELQARFPSTSIGSYPQSDHTLIRVAGPEADAREVVAAVRAHLDVLMESDEGKRLLAYIDERRARRDSATSD